MSFNPLTDEERFCAVHLIHFDAQNLSLARCQANLAVRQGI